MPRRRAPLDPDNLPYLQLFVNDWFGSPFVAELSAAEERLFLRLLMRQWQRGSLPVEVEKLERLACVPIAEFVEAWGTLEGHFPVDEDGRRRNAQCERKRSSYLGLAVRGAVGGKQRGKPKDKPKDKQRGGPSTSTSTSSPPSGSPTETGASASAPPVPARWPSSVAWPVWARPWTDATSEYLEARRVHKKASWAKGGLYPAGSAKRFLIDLESCPDELRGALLADAAAGPWLGLSQALKNGWAAEAGRAAGGAVPKAGDLSGMLEWSRRRDRGEG